MVDRDLDWRLAARVAAHDYGIFRTAFVDGEHARGIRKRFSVIECVDWVNVIALTPEDRVVLIRQYRVGVERVCLEIPGGMVDPGEDPMEAARRELAEETGYTAQIWRRLGAVAPNPAIQNNTLHSFLALDARCTRAAKLDSSEIVEVDEVPLADVKRLLRAGDIDHALVVTAFAHLAIAAWDPKRP